MNCSMCRKELDFFNVIYNEENQAELCDDCFNELNHSISLLRNNDMSVEYLAKKNQLIKKSQKSQNQYMMEILTDYFKHEEENLGIVLPDATFDTIEEELIENDEVTLILNRKANATGIICEICGRHLDSFEKFYIKDNNKNSLTICSRCNDEIYTIHSSSEREQYLSSIHPYTDQNTRLIIESFLKKDEKKEEKLEPVIKRESIPTPRHEITDPISSYNFLNGKSAEIWKDKIVIIDHGFLSPKHSTVFFYSQNPTFDIYVPPTLSLDNGAVLIGNGIGNQISLPFNKFDTKWAQGFYEKCLETFQKYIEKPTISESPISVQSENPIEKIKGLKELLDSGALTLEEFQIAKEKLLKQI